MNAPSLSRREALRNLAAAAVLPVAGGWLGGCATAGRPTTASVASTDFGRMPDGRPVRLHTLKNATGATVGVSEYGATITSILVPDRSGQSANVVFGGDSMEAYRRGLPAASVIGRYANRIHGARFTLEGREVRITANEGGNHIHGGREGFASKLWSSRTRVEGGTAVAEFRYRSVDGEEGYPGHLDVTVTYAWNAQNELLITYRAETDRATVVNLTNHAYFNLAGAGNGDVLGHELQIQASQYTPSDAAMIPTGEIAPVAGLPIDFRAFHPIGERIRDVRGPKGYDHNFVIDRRGGGLQLAARIFDAKSGRRMTCHTTEPGIQLYTANHFDGVHQPRYGAFCLETQHFPDSPNHPNFPSTVVRPGKAYQSQTRFGFSTDRTAAW
jgi:aldose 1-epimerase